jgi:hypothetical protein
VPTLIASPLDGSLMWVPAEDILVTYNDARELCSDWNSSLAVIPSARVQAAIAQAIASSGSTITAFWLNLQVSLVDTAGE